MDRDTMSGLSALHKRVAELEKRNLHMMFTYDEVLHIMRVLGDWVADARSSNGWKVRDCDMSNTIMERFRVAFGKAL